MTEYTVTWEIELDAPSPKDAAREARRIMRDPEQGTATTTHDKVTILLRPLQANNCR